MSLGKRSRATVVGMKGGVALLPRLGRACGLLVTLAGTCAAIGGCGSKSGSTGDPLDPRAAPAIDMDPSHYPTNIWVTDAMAKVRPTDGRGPVHWATISSPKNSIESFQVHVHADHDIASYSVEVGDLTNSADGSTIPSADVTVSRELYLPIAPALGPAEVPTQTAAQVSDLNGMWGEVPDALIPSKDAIFGEARNAFPVTVSAGRNASAWIDVFVPAGASAGWYKGTVTLKSANAVLGTVPIRLKVWNVSLPSTGSLRTFFGMSDEGPCDAHYGSVAKCAPAAGGASGDAGAEALHVLYATFALDHRITIGDAVYRGPGGGDWAHFDATYGPLMNGTAQTRLQGAKLTTLRYQDDPMDTSQLGAWAQHFQAKGWFDRLVYYHCDEPGGSGCSFADAQTEENAVHGVSPDFTTLLTTSLRSALDNDLLSSVDILAPSALDMQPHGHISERSAYDTKFLSLSPKKQLFWYQSCDAHESCDAAGTPGGTTSTWPSYMADASPVRNRVFQWMAYLFHVQGELYYVTDLCFQQSCGLGVAQTRDPFQSIYAFSGNGDGTLFYPGRPSAIGGTHDIPLSSIRLELIREGMQDYELLHLLDAAGDTDFATQQVSGFVRGLDDFDADASHLTGAREAIGDRLHQKSLATK